ncbi:MAG: hypothetical protein IJM57_04430, partial [Lachnospiraceae bacterium]|nr:hypothetical protein [Lachnospiraceae bacterium]
EVKTSENEETGNSDAFPVEDLKGRHRKLRKQEIPMLFPVEDLKGRHRKLRKQEIPMLFPVGYLK